VNRLEPFFALKLLPVDFAHWLFFIFKVVFLTTTATSNNPHK